MFRTLVFVCAAALPVVLLGGCAVQPSVDFSPDGERLALARGGEAEPLRLIRTDGSGSETVQETEGAQAPTWSPDGSSILFTREERICTVEVAERRVRALAAGAHPPFAWSPDNRRFTAYGYDDDGAKLRIYSFPGGDVVRSLALPFTSTSSTDPPVWLPRGEAVALLGGDDAGWNVYLVASGAVRAITTSNDLIGVGRAPCEDGILWARPVSHGKRHGVQLQRWDSRTGSASPAVTLRLTPSGGEARRVCFSPEGSHLAVTAWDGDRQSVYTGRVGAGALRRVISTRAGVSVGWSGSGRLAAVGPGETVRVYNAGGRAKRLRLH